MSRPDTTLRRSRWRSYELLGAIVVTSIAATITGTGLVAAGHDRPGHVIAWVGMAAAVAAVALLLAWGAADTVAKLRRHRYGTEAEVTP